MNINDTLIEAIFEIRWGHITPNKVEINQQDQSDFMSKFSVEMSKKGFPFTENPNSNNFPDMMPHMVRTRYRSESNKWPCYQVGTGIFTVNFVDAYDKTAFDRAIQTGLDAFSNASEHHFAKIMPTAVLIMRYQYAVHRDMSENVVSGIKDKFGIYVDLGDKLGLSENRKITALNLAFNIADANTGTNTSVTIGQVNKDDQPAYLLEVTSLLKLESTLEIDDIHSWTEKIVTYQEALYDELLGRG